MAQFNIAYSKTKSNEGGYANNPNDKGGETYMGMSRVNNPKWAGWPIIDSYKRLHGPIKTGFVIPNPQLDNLVSSYFKTEYWDKFEGDRITSQIVANIMFDFAITSGTKRSVINTQKAANVTADGSFGTDTLTAINKAPEKDLATKILANNQAYYQALADKDPAAYKWALNSWTQRINYFKSLVDKIPGGAKTVGAGGAILTGVGIFFLGKWAKWW